MVSSSQVTITPLLSLRAQHQTLRRVSADDEEYATMKTNSSPTLRTPQHDDPKTERDSSSSALFRPLERKVSLFSETSTSSSSTASSRPEVLSSQQIRSRYLHCLGVTGVVRKKNPPDVSLCSVLPSSSNNYKSLKRPRNITIPKYRCTSTSTCSKVVLLKHDLGQADTSLTLQSPPQHANAKIEGRAVGFQATVSVQSIPSRHSWSTSLKECLWMHPQEMEASAMRNYMEYTFEHCDWRQAVEEKDFVLLQGQLTHPAHADYFVQQQQRERERCNLNRQFCMILSAQQQQYQPTTAAAGYQ